MKQSTAAFIKKPSLLTEHWTSA